MISTPSMTLPASLRFAAKGPPLTGLRPKPALTPQQQFENALWLCARAPRNIPLRKATLTACVNVWRGFKFTTSLWLANSKPKGQRSQAVKACLKEYQDIPGLNPKARTQDLVQIFKATLAQFAAQAPAQPKLFPVQTLLGLFLDWANSIPNGDGESVVNSVCADIILERAQTESNDPLRKMAQDYFYDIHSEHGSDWD